MKKIKVLRINEKELRHLHAAVELMLDDGSEKRIYKCIRKDLKSIQKKLFTAWWGK